jgi:hypothetical protein
MQVEMPALEEKTARELYKFLEAESVLLSTYVQVLFHPCDSLEVELQHERMLIENSRPLVRFEFSKEHIKDLKPLYPPGIEPFRGGYILLYVPSGTQRWKEAVSIGPTFEEFEQYRLAMRCFLAGWKARGNK